MSAGAVLRRYEAWCQRCGRVTVHALGQCSECEVQAASPGTGEPTRPRPQASAPRPAVTHTPSVGHRWHDLNTDLNTPQQPQRPHAFITTLSNCGLHGVQGRTYPLPRRMRTGTAKHGAQHGASSTEVAAI